MTSPFLSPSASMKKQLNCKIYIISPDFLCLFPINPFIFKPTLHICPIQGGGGGSYPPPLGPGRVKRDLTPQARRGRGGGGTDFWLFQLIIVGGEQLSKNNRDCQAQNGYTASPRTAYKDVNLELATKKKSVKYN